MLVNTFPVELTKKIDLCTLKLENAGFINEELKEYYADLVFTCTYQDKERIKVTLLLEHKSTKERYPHMQLLKYLLKMWEQDIKQLAVDSWQEQEAVGRRQRDKKLTPVIPVIIYHGKGKWQYKSFQEYFSGAGRDLARFIPGFDYILLDISDYDDKKIEAFTSGFLKVATFLMKYSREEKYLEDHLKEIFTTFVRDVTGKEDEEKVNKFMEVSVRYLLMSAGIAQEKIIKIFYSISKKYGETAMTTGMKLINQGLQQGLQQGRQEGLQEGLQQGKQEGLQEGLYTSAKIIRLYRREGKKLHEIAKTLAIDERIVRKVLNEAGLLD